MPGLRERFGDVHRKAALIGAVAILCLLSTGCMGFRGGLLEETRPWPPQSIPSAKKPSVGVSVLGKCTFNGQPRPLTPAKLDAWVQYTRETYEASGLFSKVTVGSEGADLRAEIQVADAESGSPALAYICGLTLTVIPCRGRDDLTWQTTFKDAGGNVLGVVERREQVTLWIQTLLLFGMPFASPKSVARDLFTDLNKATLLDALERGYVPH